MLYVVKIEAMLVREIPEPLCCLLLYSVLQPERSSLFLHREEAAQKI